MRVEDRHHEELLELDPEGGVIRDNAASAQIQQVAFKGQLAGHSVAQAMSTQCADVPADIMLQKLVDASPGRQPFVRRIARGFNPRGPAPRWRHSAFQSLFNTARHRRDRFQRLRNRAGT